MNSTIARRVASLDLSQESAYLQAKYGMTDEAVAYLEDLYRKFLVLCLTYPHAGLTPSEAIDLFWHAHLANEKKYRADCIMLAGRMIGHDPTVRGEDMERRFAKTCLYFKKHFGIDLRRSELPVSCANIFMPNAAGCAHVAASCGHIAASCGHAHIELAIAEQVTSG